MPDTTRKTLRLIFTTDDPKKNFTITLLDPKIANCTSVYLSALMTSIIAYDAFLTPGGALVGIGGMEVADASVDDLLE
ncbi:MAG: DUF2922 domain-containing protein [bacterium]